MNKITVENDTMRFYSTPVPIPVGGSQWSKIFFMFSNEWEDLRKIAQFRQGELKRNVDIDSNNFCYVPNEMLPDMCGELSIVGYPQDTASAVIATANSLMLNFVQGFESGGEPAVPPTPDLYQKLLKEFAESGGGTADAVTYTPQTLTEEQQAQARTNIGALDVNIKTTPVDIGVGLGSTVYYVQSGWLKPCPDNTDKELRLQYRRVFEFIGSQYLKPSSQDMLLEAKSAYALYQKGLASESIKVTYNPLAAAQVYVKWNLSTRNNKHYFYYAQVSTAYQYTCTYCVEDDALVTETYERPVYRTSNGVGEQDDVSQFRMSAAPTEDMHIATKQYVDTAKTEAQQLGLTAATPGQIIKVKAVQDGKPTEWEAVDMPGGGELILEYVHDESKFPPGRPAVYPIAYDADTKIWTSDGRLDLTTIAAAGETVSKPYQINIIEPLLQLSQDFDHKKWNPVATFKLKVLSANTFSTSDYVPPVIADDWSKYIMIANETVSINMPSNASDKIRMVFDGQFIGATRYTMFGTTKWFDPNGNTTIANEIGYQQSRGIYNHIVCDFDLENGKIYGTTSQTFVSYGKIGSAQGVYYPTDAVAWPQIVLSQYAYAHYNAMPYKGRLRIYNRG